ncbi:DUF3098 domain-containing protein [Ferruginibacter lapsinanis]|uniref:DUF3098 domain-containing protein n=1 Tax=Ferruginibacter lapsinanis TaxID=563172 RepID=UPI001E611A39|nr:DUF3098 domain-containing protein [Ferruginibacter lapsinanis]UEG50417.1 DUF3098 domain-containing protein [Ferruginibacter lapsinanis]
MNKNVKQPTPASLFGKENYMLMLGGLIVLALGFFLMAGGKSPDPTKFNDAEIYSTTRITVAPLLIVIGFIIEIVAIMKKPKTN